MTALHDAGIATVLALHVLILCRSPQTIPQISAATGMDRSALGKLRRRTPEIFKEVNHQETIPSRGRPVTIAITLTAKGQRLAKSVIEAFGSDARPKALHR